MNTSVLSRRSKFSFSAFCKLTLPRPGVGQEFRWKCLTPPGLGLGLLLCQKGPSPGCSDTDMESAGEGGMEAGLEQVILSPGRTEREGGRLTSSLPSPNPVPDIVCF